MCTTRIIHYACEGLAPILSTGHRLSYLTLLQDPIFWGIPILRFSKGRIETDKLHLKLNISNIRRYCSFRWIPKGSSLESSAIGMGGLIMLRMSPRPLAAWIWILDCIAFVRASEFSFTAFWTQIPNWTGLFGKTISLSALTGSEGLYSFPPSSSRHSVTLSFPPFSQSF